MSEDALLQSIEELGLPTYFFTPASKSKPSLGSVDSHFGGYAYLGRQMSWPHCRRCQNALDLVVQIETGAVAQSKSLPTKRELPALFNLFYCWECLPSVLYKDTQNQCSSLNLFQKINLQNYLPLEHPDENVTQTAAIEFQPGELFPAYVDFKNNQATLYRELSNRLSDVRRQNKDYAHYREDLFYEDVIEQLSVAPCFSFVGGYPQWLTKNQTPSCEQCGQEMIFLAQLDSEEQVDLNWGNQGCCYIFYCKKHTGQYRLIIQN